MHSLDVVHFRPRTRGDNDSHVVIREASPFVRRFVRLDRLSANNEVAGFKFATVGVLYAVLLAFMVIVVWSTSSDAESDVSREAGAAATIYRLVDGIDGEIGATLRNAMTALSAIGDGGRLAGDGKRQGESGDNTRIGQYLRCRAGL